jgi:hypothetical protein
VLLLTDHRGTRDLYQLLLSSHYAVPYCFVLLAGMHNSAVNKNLTATAAKYNKRASLTALFSK